MVYHVWPAQITGRVKELYKLENGKYVAPAVVEKALLEHPLVAQGTDTTHEWSPESVEGLG